MGLVTAVPDEGLGNTSYIVDLDDGLLAVIDPVRDPSVYLRHAEARAADVAFAIETHLHADFVSGSRELAARGRPSQRPHPRNSSIRTVRYTAETKSISVA